MHRFKVVVPFDAVLAESLDSTAITRLPNEETSIAGLIVSGVPDAPASYQATQVVLAEAPRAAKIHAMAQVEDLLFLLALTGASFQIRTSRVTVGSLGRHEPPAGDTAERQFHALPVAETVVLTEQVGVVKGRTDLDPEEQALRERDGWPEHVRRALELNYLAARHPDSSVKFLLLASALEVLAGATVGSPPGLLNSRLTKCKLRLLRAGVARLLTRFGFEADDRKRLIDHLNHTYAHPVPVQLHRYLAEVGLELEVQEVKRWWGLRGPLAHGSALDPDTVRGEVLSLRTAIGSALKAEVGL